MRIRFETFYKGLMVVLAVALFWTVWGCSQQAKSNANSGSSTNQVASAAATNAPSATAPAASGQSKNSAAGESRSGVQAGYLTFGLDKVPYLKNHYFINEPLWRYIASFIYIFLAFYVSKFLDYLTRVWLKRLATKTKTKFDDLLLDTLNGPVKIVAFVIFLHVGLNLFNWSEALESFINKGLTIVVSVALTYMTLKLVDLLMGTWHQRASTAHEDQQFNQLLFPMIRKALKVFVLVVAVLITAPHVGMDITGLIASLSIGGLAFGLAAQDTVANLFGAVSLFADKPFHIGDLVNVEGHLAIIEGIGLRSTRVRNLDGHLITIPNKTMGNAIITNVTKRPNIKTMMNIGVTYDTPADRVQRAVDIMYEVFRNHPRTADVWISFNTFADSSLNLQVIHWWGATDYKEYLNGLHDLNLTIKKRFDEESINFAFPTRTLYLKQDSDWRVQGDAAPLPPRAQPGN